MVRCFDRDLPVDKYCKVKNSLLLINDTIADPYIIYPDAIEGDQSDWFPYSHGVHRRCPIPTILITWFSCVGILEWHWINSLSHLIIAIGRLDDYFHHILSFFQPLSDFELVLYKRIVGAPKKVSVERYFGICVDALEDELTTLSLHAS